MIGSFRNRVRVQHPGGTVDPADWYCAISPVAAPVSEGLASFAMRGRFHPGITIETHLIHEGRTFQVQGAVDVDARHREMQLLCVEVVGRSGTSYTPAPELPPTAYQSEIIAEGPIAYWPLDDPSGSAQARDLMGSAHGLISGGVTLNQAGLEGACAHFNGSGAIQTVAPLSIPANVSYEFWIKAPAGGATYVLALDELAIDGATTIRGDGIGKLIVSMLNRPASPLFGAAIVYDDAWHLVNVTTAPNGVFLYHDGLMDSVMDIPPIAFAGRVSIGESFVDLDWGLIGSLQDVAIYPRVLLPAEIAAHYRLRFP